MATLTMPPTVRRPFASLDTPRMHSFSKAKTNLRTKQNGSPMPWKNKTRIMSGNSENMDPNTLNQSMKRKRGSSDEDDEKENNNDTNSFKKVSPTKSYRLNVLPPGESKINKDNVPQPPSTPTKPTKSFLKPAGRSPRAARPCKAFARRSPISKSRPESRTTKGSNNSVTRPFSIATALSNPKPTAKSVSVAPASWFFEIHVDSPQEEMTNLVQHSTCVLDISDNQAKRKGESRGKENIPPQESGIDLPNSRQQVSAATAAACKKDVPEDRSPLGELKASDHYGAGCNAFSCAIVYEDESENLTDQKKSAAASTTAARQHFVSRSSGKPKIPKQSSIASPLNPTTPIAPAARHRDSQFQIWEGDGDNAIKEVAQATKVLVKP